MPAPPPLPPEGSSAPALSYQSRLTETDGVIRFDGVSVVALDRTVFPPRCIKCNSDSDLKSTKRNLVWSPPWMYFLLLFPGLLIGGIILVATQRKASITIFACRACRKKWNKRVLAAWGIFLAALPVFFAAIFFRSGILAVLGALLVLASAVYGIVRCPMITTSKIDGKMAHIRGAGPEFIRGLDVR